ncbi:MAG: ABC transporter ATP-binding protein [Candidatus Kryptoniota bacterium]
MIEFTEVSKKFSGQPALNSISFRVEKGVACGYIGPNGAGKTTTAKIIVGLEKPDSGKVRILSNLEFPSLNHKGKKPKSEIRNSKSQIGYVPESPKLYESLTPSETIALAALLRQFDKKCALDKLEFLAEVFSFEDWLKKPLQSLSKGTKQKVVISMALIFKPEILVLDEPTDGLDVQSVVSLKRFIKSFTAHGGAVFYSSHLLDIVENVCDKVYFINKGNIAAEYARENFIDKKGYLENALLENIGDATEQRSIDAFLEDKI